MKEKIWAAIVECLDTHASEANIDELLTDAVMQAMEAAQPTRLAVKYIGRRDLYSDGLYNTGDWAKDQVKLVEIATARKMLEHQDVYASGEKEEASEAIDPENPIGDEADHLDEARQAVMGMRNKAAVSEFVANSFSGATLNLPQNAKLETYRLEAIRMIDQYHLPK